MRPAIAVATLVVVVAAGCGGSAVGDYVDTVAATTEQMTRDAFAALPPGAAPTRSQIEAVVGVRRVALDTISGLTPPTAMKPEHLALAVAMTSFVVASEEFVATSAGLDPDTFLAALEASTDIDALADAVSVACTAWEHRAADLDHAVELGC